MSTSSARGRWTAVLIGALLAALSPAALAACTSDGADPPPTADDTTSTTGPSTTSPSTSTTTTPPTPEEEVEQAYLAIVDRYYRRFANPDPQDPTLRQDFAGDALDSAVATAEDLATKGHRFQFSERGQPRPELITTSLSGDTAVVTNCIVDDGVLFSDSDGIIDDSVSTSLLSTTLTTDGQRWRISAQSVTQKWEDGLGCDR